MTEDEYEDILYDHRYLRLFARIFGTLEAALLFYMAFTEFREEIANHSPSPLLTMIDGHYFLAVTLTVAFIGLILAWRKEGLGGGISLACFLALFIGGFNLHVEYIFGMTLATLPSVLYFLYWLLVYLDVQKAKRDQQSFAGKG